MLKKKSRKEKSKKEKSEKGMLPGGKSQEGKPQEEIHEELHPSGLADWCKLIEVQSEFEANNIIDFLKSEGIEAVEQHNVGGIAQELYMGKSYTGINIFVEEEVLEKARALIHDFLEL